MNLARLGGGAFFAASLAAPTPSRSYLGDGWTISVPQAFDRAVWVGLGGRDFVRYAAGMTSTARVAAERWAISSLRAAGRRMTDLS